MCERCAFEAQMDANGILGAKPFRLEEKMGGIFLRIVWCQERKL